MPVKPSASEKLKKIDELINKGAKVKEEVPQSSNVWKVVSLRITEKLLKEVDQTAKKRVGLVRNAWILEAIQEKLERENE